MSLTNFLNRLRKRIHDRHAQMQARTTSRLRVSRLEERKLLDASFGLELGGILSLGDFDSGEQLQLSGGIESGAAAFTLRSGVWDPGSLATSASSFSLSNGNQTLTLSDMTGVSGFRIDGGSAGGLHSVTSTGSGVQVSALHIEGARDVNLDTSNNDFDTLRIQATTASVQDVDDLTLVNVRVAETLSIDLHSGELDDVEGAVVEVGGEAGFSADTIVLGNHSADEVSFGTLLVNATADVSVSSTSDIHLTSGTAGREFHLAANGDILAGTGLEIEAASVFLTAGGDIGADDGPLTVKAEVLNVASGGSQFIDTDHVYLGSLSGHVIRLESGTFVTDADTDVSGVLELGEGSVLKGNGTVDDVEGSAGLIAPGNSPGILNSGDFAPGAGSTLAIELLGTTPGTEHDQVNVTGTVDLTGVNLLVDLQYVPVIGDSYVIVNNDAVDAVTGTFSGLAEGALFTSGGEWFSISYSGGDGNDVVVSNAAHVFDFSSSSFSGTESDGTISGTVTRSGFTDVATTVDVVVGLASGALAAESSDFNAEAITLTFAAGQTSAVFAVTVSSDLIVEDDEQISLTLSGFGSGGGLGTTQSTATTIIGNDDTAILSIAPLSFTESDSAQVVNATVTLNAEVEGGLDVAYAMGLISAESTDVSVSGSSLSFVGSIGETQSISMTIAGDEIVEDTETFSITLGSVTGTSIVQAAAIGTSAAATFQIQNDDSVTLAILNVTATESDTDQTAMATVQLNAEVEGGFQVDYSLGLISAESTDVSLSGSSLAFAGTSGETQLISVTIFGDEIVEDTETFLITLGDVSGTSFVQDAAISTGASSSNQIQNDDLAVLSIDNVTVNESAGTATFTVTSTNVSEEALNVSVGLTHGTTSAADVVLNDSTATIAGDSTSLSTNVTVAISDDLRVEGQENYSLTLSSALFDGFADASRVIIGTPSGTGLVNDNESVVVEFVAATSVVDENDASHAVDVRLSVSAIGNVGTTGLDQTITVDVDRTGGTARPADPEADFAYTDTTLSFSNADGPGASFTKSVSVTTFEDILDDDSETLQLSLQGLTDGTGGLASVGAVDVHTLTITDDDSGTAVFDLVTGGGDVVVVANGANLEFYAGGVLQSTRAAADVSELIINGTASNESLTLDFTGGVFSTNVRFDGGAGDDTVFIVGAAGGSDVRVMYDAADSEAGVVDIDGTRLTYFDIENNSLNISGLSDLTLDFAGGDTGIAFDRLSATQTQVTGSSFTTTNFTSPVDSLTLNFTDGSNYGVAINDLADDFDPVSGLDVNGNAGGGNINLTIDQLGGMSGKALDIDLGGGTDSVVFQNTAQAFSALSIAAETVTATTSSIAVTGSMNLDAGPNGSIILDNVANDFSGTVSVFNTDSLSIDDDNGIRFGLVTTQGNLTVDAGGTIDLTAAVIVGGDLDLESDANGAPGSIVDSTGNLSVTGMATLDSGVGDIILNDTANDFGGSVTVTSANHVTLVDSNALQLAGISSSGNLTVDATAIDLTGLAIVGDSADLEASTGAITDTGGQLQVTGVTSLTAGTSVVLDAATNQFGTLNVSAAAATIVENADSDIGTVAIVGAFSLTSAGAIEDATADSLTDVAAAVVDLNAATGIGSIRALELSSTSLSIDTTAGSVDVQNTSSAVALVTSLTTGNGAIAFDQTGGGDVSFTGLVASGGAVSGGMISLTSSAGLTIDSSASVGSAAGTGGTLTLAGSSVLGLISVGAGDVFISGSAVDLTIGAALSSGNDIQLSAQRDVIINAVVDGSNGANITIVADSNLGTDTGSGPTGGHGGVSIAAAGQLNADGDVSVTGSDLFSTSGVIDSVSIDSNGGTAQVDAQGRVRLQDGSNAPIGSQLIVNGLVRAAGVTSAIELSSEGDVVFGVDGDLVALSGSVTITADSRAGSNGGRVVQADGAQVTANGAIDVSADGSVVLGQLSSLGTITVVSRSGQIVDSGDSHVDLVASSLSMTALTGIGSDSNAIESQTAGVGTLVLAAETDSGDIHIANSGSLTIGSVGGLVGATIGDANGVGSDAQDSTDDNITFIAASPLTVNAAVVNNDGGGISLTSTDDGGADDHLTINADLTVTGGNLLIDGTGNISLNAGTNLVVASAVSTDAGGTISGQAVADVLIQSGSLSNILGTISVTATTGAVTMTDATSIQSTSGDIDLSAGTAVAVSQVRTSGRAVVTATAGAIVDSGDSNIDVTAGEAVLRAATGIGNGGPLETAIGTLVFSNSTSGNIELENSQSLLISGIGGLTSASNDGGDIEICLTSGDLVVATGLTATGDSIRLQAGSGGISQSAAGAISAANLGARATGAIDLDLAINNVEVFAAESTVAGDVEFNDADGFSVGSLTSGACFIATNGVSTADGAITMTTSSGDLIVTDSIVAGGAGDVTMITTSSGNVVLTGTTTADGDLVTISSAGSIDGAGLARAAEANLGAFSGIGATTALELSVASLAADTTNGSIDINNTLATATVVSDLTVSGAAGSITFDQAGGGSVSFGNVSSNDGAVQLQNAGGDLVVSGTVDAGGSGDVSLSTVTFGDVLLTGVTSAVGNQVSVDSVGRIIGDSPDAVADIRASSVVLVAANGIGDGAGAGLELTTDSLTFSNTTSGDVQISNSQALILGSASNAAGSVELCVLTGNLVLNGALTAGTNTIRLQSSIGSVTETATGSVIAGELGVRASTGISLTSASNNVSAFAAETDAGNIEFVEADGFAAGTVTSGDCFVQTVGVTTSGTGAITLNALTGALDLDQVVSSSSGSIDIDADNGQVNIDAAIQSTSGSIDVTGDSVSQGADIVTNGIGTIDVTADNGSIIMSDGAFSQTVAGTIAYDATNNVDIGLLSSGTGNLMVAADSDSDFSGSITDATAGESANLNTSGQASLSAASGIGASGLLDIDTTIGSLQATNTTSGDIVVQEADTLEIVGTGVQTTGGNGWVDIDVDSGALLASQAVSANGSGNVTLNADTGTVTLDAAIASGSGNVIVQADRVDQNADISTSAVGTISVSADLGSIVMSNDVESTTGTGGISYAASDSVALTRLASTGGTVNVTATAGSISDVLSGEGAGSENIVATLASLTAAADIGVADEIDVEVDSLIATSTVGGSIAIAETDQINLLNVDTADGAVSVIAGGAVFAIDVESLTDSDANDISLVSTGEGIDVMFVNAGSQGDVVLNAFGGNVTNSGGTPDLISDSLSVIASGGVDLDTTISTVHVTTTGTGDVVIDETDAVELVDIITSDGSTTITANGTVTATSVSVGGGANSDVNVTTSAGGIVATSVMASGSVFLNAVAGNVTATSVTASAGSVDIDASAGNVLIDRISANGPDAPAVAVAIDASVDIVDQNGVDLNIEAVNGVTQLTAGRDVGFASTDVFKPTADDPLEVRTADLRIIAGRNVAVAEMGSGALTILTADTAFLTSVGDLDLSSGVVTTDNLSLVVGGLLTLPVAATPLSVAEDLRIEAGDVAVSSGVIDINARRLLFKSGQSETLNLTVSEFDGEAVGDLTVSNDSAAMELVDLDCDLTAIDVGANVVTLNQSAGSVVSQRLPITGTENSRILGGSLVLGGAGIFQLTNLSNDVDTLAGANVGAITISDVDELEVGTVGGIIGLQSTNSDVFIQTGAGLSFSQVLNAGTGDARLLSNGGVVQQTNGRILANELGVRDLSVQDVRLVSANDVNSLSIDNSAGGSIAFADIDSVVVDSVAGATVSNLNFSMIDGIVGDNVLIDAGDDLTVNQTVSAADAVRFAATGSVTQASTGTIASSQLAVRQRGAIGVIELDAANRVDVFAADSSSIGGHVAFRNTQQTEVGTVSQLVVDGLLFNESAGIATVNGDVLLTTDQGLSFNASVNTAGGDVRLNSEDGVVQDANGAIVADELGIRNFSSGSVLLGSASNDINTLSVENLAEGGSTTFFDTDDLTVGAVIGQSLGVLTFASSVGIDTNAGDISLTSTDDLTINQNVDAAHATQTTSIDESITLVSRSGDFVLADGITVSSDENTAAGEFDNLTGDTVTIVAGSGGTNGVVRIGVDSEVRTDGGVARQIAPRPTAFAAVPASGSQNAFVTLTDAENMRSSLNFVNGGFLGEFELVFGVAGEENLEVVIDWGVVSQTSLTSSGPAAAATETSPGEFEFGLGDADKTVFFIGEGGALYEIPHLYAPADLLTTPNDRNGREINPNIIGVRFSVAQHESINIWGNNATDPGGVPDTAPPTFTGTSGAVTDATGAAIFPGGNLALLSSTDTNGLDDFTQEAAQLPFANQSQTPTGQPEGLAEWEFLAGPSPGVIPVQRFAEQTFDAPIVEVPEISTIITDTAGDVNLGSGASGESAIGTEVYLQIRRHFELDVEAEVVIQRITDNSFISSRESFEAFVEENPILQDGDGYEVWLITETGGQKVARPIVQFEITGGRPGPATEEVPETFEPYQLKELEFEQPSQPQPADDKDTNDNASILSPEKGSDVVFVPDAIGGKALGLVEGNSPAAGKSPQSSETELTLDGTILHTTDERGNNEGTQSESESPSQIEQGNSGIAESAEAVALPVLGLSAAARWRRRQERRPSLSNTAIVARRLKRDAGDEAPKQKRN